MSIVEHVVVFRVKHDVSPSEVNYMVEKVNSLVSLEEPLHLAMGSLVRIRFSPTSTSTSSFNFTHILHSRFNSKEDLHAYAVDPAHVAVVKANAPNVADTMALDWVAEAEAAALVPPPGSAVRVTLFKVKEGLGDEVKDEVLRVIKGIQGELKLKQSVEFTSGENFSPGRAKGFSFASLAVFPGLSELEAVDADEEIGKYHENDEIKEHLDCVVVLDYVVPSTKAEE